PTRSLLGTGLLDSNPRLRRADDPFSGTPLVLVPALAPDVAIVHVQRADRRGDAQVWGLLGVQKEAAFAAARVIVVAEEIVEESVLRADPNRTLLPGLVVDAVVHEPFGCHPSYAQGYYDRDNAFYVGWREISEDRGRLEAYLDEWVHGVPDRAAYAAKLGAQVGELRARPRVAGAVDYGF
ncbi:MAG: CoA transferase subunit A, partial [Thermoanaerobaculia bacterium]